MAKPARNRMKKRRKVMRKMSNMSDEDRAERLEKYRARFAARNGQGDAPVRTGFRSPRGRALGRRRGHLGRGASSYARAVRGPKETPPGQAIKENLMAKVETGTPQGSPRKMSNAYKRRLRQNKDLPRGMRRGMGRGRR